MSFKLSVPAVALSVLGVLIASDITRPNAALAKSKAAADPGIHIPPFRPSGSGTGTSFRPGGGATPSEAAPAGGATPAGPTGGATGGSGSSGGATPRPGASGGATGRGTAAGASGGKGAPGAGGATGGGRKVQSADVDWMTWWTLHGDRVERVKESYERAAAAGVTGSTAGGDYKPTRRANEMERATVLAELERIAADDYEIRPTAHASMGRVADEKQKAAVQTALVKFLGDGKTHNRYWGFVGLAALDHADIAKPLIAMLENTGEGQKLLAASANLNDATRAWAALSLGFSKNEAAVEPLKSVVVAERGVSPDLRDTAVVALGELGRAGIAQDAIFKFLLDRSREKSLDQTARAHAVTALALVGSRSAVSPLKTLATSTEVPAIVRQSAVVGLGELAFGFESDLVAVLLDLAAKDSDAGVRHFAVMAIATMARTEPAMVDRGAKGALLDEIRSALITGISATAKHKADRPWYLLASGIFGGRFKEDGKLLAPAMQKLALSAPSAEDRATASVALGFLEADGVLETLRKIATESDDFVVRCFALEGLAMRRDLKTKDVIVKESRDAKDEWMRFRMARALAFYGDPTNLKALIADMASTNSEAVRAALTLALGIIGDKTSIEGLVAIAKDKKLTTMARERAVGALGLVAQRADETWNEPIRRHINPAIVTPTLATIVNIF